MSYNPSQYPACTVPVAEVTRVKGLGFLRDKTTPDCFNARVITRNGKITAAQAVALAEAAHRFGNGELAFTTRMTVELQQIPYANIESLRLFLAQHGMETGGTGPRVRPVVSCKGTTCVFGLIDTHGLAEKIHERFYQGYRAVKLPHKFKIGVGGCPNNCAKPDLNDVGIVGAWQPVLVPDRCSGCGACVRACPIHTASLQNGKFATDNACNACGRCVRACKLGGLDCKQGYRITVGGRWGKQVARGTALAPLFESEGDVLDTVEKILLFFREQGAAGERLSDTVARVGFSKAEQMILGNELLERKHAILEKAL